MQKLSVEIILKICKDVSIKTHLILCCCSFTLSEVFLYEVQLLMVNHDLKILNRKI